MRGVRSRSRPFGTSYATYRARRCEQCNRVVIATSGVRYLNVSPLIISKCEDGSGKEVDGLAGSRQLRRQFQRVAEETKKAS